jgi:hypothetical protein
MNGNGSTSGRPPSPPFIGPGPPPGPPGPPGPTGGAGGGLAYSTSETQVGTWLDERVIYQTTFILDPALVGPGPDGNGQAIPHGISGIDLIVGFEPLINFTATWWDGTNNNLVWGGSNFELNSVWNTSTNGMKIFIDAVNVYFSDKLPQNFIDDSSIFSPVGTYKPAEIYITIRYCKLGGRRS